MILRNCSKYVNSSFVRRCSKATMEQLVNMDSLECVKVNLPLHPKFSLDLKYYDSSPNEQGNGVIVATHGSPGTHKDFKYMVPSLLSAGFRVIILNWPGFGVTDNPPDKYFTHTNLERAQLLSSFAKAINLKKIDCIIGHSSGCWPLAPFLVDNPNVCSAAVLIAPGCLTPHKALRPYFLTTFFAGLLDTWLKPVISYFLYFCFTKLFDMKVQHRNHAAVATRIMAGVDFKSFRGFVSTLKETKNPPIVLTCAGKDHLIEKEKSLEYAEKLGCNEHDGVYQIESSSEMNEVVQKMLSSSGGKLKKHFAILFTKGNHFIQKHEASGICTLIRSIIESNKIVKY